MKISLKIECFFGFLVVVSAIYIVISFALNGFLPQPFTYDTNDTFMDWFNTAYWAYHDGAYDIWHSVYPPFSFLFIRIFSFGDVYQYSSFVARDKDWLSVFCIISFYIVAGFFAFKSFKINDRETAIIRTAAFMIGFPMLFALERGNLIIPCLIFFMMGFGAVFRSAKGRWFGVALALNFKPYLLSAILPLLARRKYRWVEGCGLVALSIYAVSFLLVGDGSLLSLIKNTSSFQALIGSSYYMDLYNSTSFSSILNAVSNGPFPLMKSIGSKPIEIMAFWFPFAIFFGRVLAFISFIFVFMQSSIANDRQVGALGLATMLAASNPGGYAEVFLVFLIFLQPRESVSQISTLVCAYLLCISFDKVIYVVNKDAAESWLGGREVTRHFGIAAGQFVRPALILGIQYALALGVISKFLKIAYSDRWGPSKRLGSC